MTKADEARRRANSIKDEIATDFMATLFMAAVLWDYLWHHSHISRFLRRLK